MQFTSDLIDQEGHSTLKIISEANHFNAWMFDVISRHCSGKVLEVGSGIGNISSFFIHKKFETTVSDLRPGYCNHLRAAFGDTGVAVIENLDLTAEKFDSKFHAYASMFDTVVALNVIEHIADDHQAITLFALPETWRQHGHFGSRVPLAF